MTKFNNITELTCNLHLIPENVAVDTLKRILDWLTSDATSQDDDYIKKQLNYASRFIDQD